MSETTRFLIVAPAFANTIVPDEIRRELIITVSLPQDKGLHRDGRPNVHRFRSQWLAVGQQLRDFRARFRLTQAEVAQAVGAAGPSAIAQWESGTTVPEGIRRERLMDLPDGRLWPALRAAASSGDGLLETWSRGARWYRRASRERLSRETIGVVVASIINDLRTVQSPGALHEQYHAHDGEWVLAVAKRCGLGAADRFDLRRLEDAAYGLRWLEIVHRLALDLRRSLASQLPPSLPDDVTGRATVEMDEATGGFE